MVPGNADTPCYDHMKRKFNWSVEWYLLDEKKMWKESCFFVSWSWRVTLYLYTTAYLDKVIFAKGVIRKSKWLKEKSNSAKILKWKRKSFHLTSRCCNKRFTWRCFKKLHRKKKWKKILLCEIRAVPFQNFKNFMRNKCF